MSHYKRNSRIIIGVFLTVLLALYPIGVYLGLSYFEPWLIGLLLLVVIGARFWYLKSKASAIAGFNLMWAVYAGALLAIAALLLNNKTSLIIYPLVINLVFFAVFFYSVIYPPTIIERLARLKHADLTEEAIVYTRKVTLVWCAFFVFNALASAYTAFFMSIEAWTLYNGLISYVLIGLLFGIEFLIRIQKMRPK